MAFQGAEAQSDGNGMEMAGKIIAKEGKKLYHRRATLVVDYSTCRLKEMSNKPWYPTDGSWAKSRELPRKRGGRHVRRRCGPGPLAQCRWECWFALALSTEEQKSLLMNRVLWGLRYGPSTNLAT